MKNYKIQTGCHSCSHVFIRREFDEGEMYFCTFGSPERPKCLSVFMGELPEEYLDIDKFEAYQAAWDKWAHGRQVAPCGICDCYLDHVST